MNTVYLYFVRKRSSEKWKLDMNNFFILLSMNEYNIHNTFV